MTMFLRNSIFTLLFSFLSLLALSHSQRHIPIIRRFQYNDQRTDFLPLTPSQAPQYTNTPVTANHVTIPLPKDLYPASVDDAAEKRFSMLHTPLKIQFRIENEFMTPWITILDPEKDYLLQNVNFEFYSHRGSQILRVHVDGDAGSALKLSDYLKENQPKGGITDALPITFTYQFKKISKDMASDLGMGYMFSVALIALGVVSMYRVMGNLDQIIAWITERRRERQQGGGVHVQYK